MTDWRGKRAKEDEQLHEQLRVAVLAGRVEIFTDARALDFQGSPVHAGWDHLGPLLGLMLLALALLLGFGVAVGIVAMTVCAFAHLLGNKHFVAWRLKRRTIAFMLENALHWAAVWHLGGVALVLRNSGEPPCLAPKGDWRKFAVRNLGEGDAVAPAPPPVEPGKPVPLPPPEPPPPPASAPP